jgi:hypothetical protein
VLDALNQKLRDNYGLVPILFDWEPSGRRDLTETVPLIANMCRFVIADISSPVTALATFAASLQVWRSFP